MPVSAAIAGATGLVGSHCVALLRSTYDRVIATARSDFDHLDIVDLTCDHAFCALGTTIRKAGSQADFRRVDYEYIVAFARRTLEGGARKFLLVSSVGADPKSRNFYLRTKGETEAAVTALGFDAVHIFRPTFLIGQRAESRPGERIGIVVARAIQWMLVGPLSRYHPVAAHDVARAMVAAAASPARGIHIHEYGALRR